MQVYITILEKLDSKKPATFRKRSVSVTTDSVTIGSDESADVVLKAHSRPFILEIKNSDNEWWLINSQRMSGVKVGTQALDGLEIKLQHKDQISVDGHKMLFEIKEAEKLEPHHFISQPASDAELWNYLLSEKEFDEIMINGANHIYVDRQGVLLKSPWSFSSDVFLQEKITEHTRGATGWASWRLNRILRIQAALPPIVERPHLSIRKAKQTVLSLEQLQDTAFGTIDEIDFLREALRSQKNILISGGTSTGKTVLLRSLVEKIDPNERLVIVEEEAETDWPHPHAVAIESGRGNLRSTVIECLRMRPTRLIISEVRGAEAFEMLQAMNTGHAGSMTTLHASSAREALSRLENLVLSAGVPLTVSAVRRQIATAIQVIVQLGRDTYGRRHIHQIVQVGGIQQDIILLSDPVGLEAKGLKQKLSLVD